MMEYIIYVIAKIFVSAIVTFAWFIAFYITGVKWVDYAEDRNYLEPFIDGVGWIIALIYIALAGGTLAWLWIYLP